MVTDIQPATAGKKAQCSYRALHELIGEQRRLPSNKRSSAIKRRQRQRETKSGRRRRIR
jgi:hypothetical protein